MEKKIVLNSKYIPLFKSNSNIRYVLLSGGRASGKSFASSLYLANKFVSSKSNSLYLRQYLTNANISTIPQFLNQVSVLHLEPYLTIKQSVILNNRGGSLFFKGIQTSANTADSQLKSIPHLETVLIEEATEIKEDDFTKLDFSIRDRDVDPKIILAFNPSTKDHWIYRKFYQEKGLNYDYSGIEGNVLYIHTTYLDNIKHLSESFIDEANTIKVTNRLKYNNIFMGEWRSNAENALWTTNMMDEAHTIKEPPADYDNIVIGVDPAVTTNRNSDETGIIVAGIKDGEYYVIAEKTGKYTPMEWAVKVDSLYRQYNADNVVVETNQGGDLCISNLRTVCGEFMRIDKVRASKGKIARAEPVAALYEQHKVHHLAYFDQLEYEMMTFTGDSRDKSPNSLDACVWALTYLAENSYKDSSGY